MSYKTIMLDYYDNISKITLNRPSSLNAFNKDLRAELLSALDLIEDDKKINVVIIAGAGRGFSAGADLAEGFPDPISRQLNEEYKPVLTKIFGSEKLFIAQVHGSAAGIGAALAMCCDLLIMAEDANLYMAFAAIALVPDGGNTWLLLQQMGYRRALEVVVEGKKINASECHHLGLANRVAPLDELEAATLSWAQNIAAKSPLANSAAKRLLRTVGMSTYGDAISQEAREQDPLIRSADFDRGVKAFFAKTVPVFEGN